MAKYWFYHRPPMVGTYPDRYSGHEDLVSVTTWHPNNPQVTLWTGVRIHPYGEIEYENPISLEEAIHFSLIPQDEHECACYLALAAACGNMAEYARQALDYQRRGLEALREEIAQGWARRDAVFYLRLLEDFEKAREEA